MRGRGVLAAGTATLVVVCLMTSCTSSSRSNENGGSPTSAPATDSGPPTEITITPSPADTVASDCSAASTPVPVTGVLPLGAFTDSTRTALLVKNTGLLTLLIVPGNTASTLDAASYADPTDLPDTLALDAVAHADLPSNDPYWPPTVPLDQVYIVPPQWAVCALVPTAGEDARINASEDKFASAAYFTAQKLALSAQDYLTLTPDVLKQGQAFITCAQGTVSLLDQNKDENEDQLYSSAIETGSACHTGYQTLFADDETDLPKASDEAIDLLDKTPKLIEDEKFISELIGH